MKKMKKKYASIISHLESCLEKYGDSCFGEDYRKPENPNKIYKVMLECIPKETPANCTLLDFGCGCSHLYSYILENGYSNITYSGLDMSEKFLAISKEKYPTVDYYQGDILTDNLDLPNFDYIVMIGIFTEKCNLSYEDMFDYFKKTIKQVFEKVNICLTFNVISKQVDWERDDLFHLPFDPLATFLTNEVSRHFLIRHDYGLYEYTVYVYKNPTIPK